MVRRAHRPLRPGSFSLSALLLLPLLFVLVTTTTTSPMPRLASPLHHDLSLLLPLDARLCALLGLPRAASTDAALSPLVLVFPILLVLLRQLGGRGDNVVVALKHHMRMAQLGMVAVLLRRLYPVESVLGRHVACEAIARGQSHLRVGMVPDLALIVAHGAI